jgi:glycosyltransferase involved in cell wall biosynthesis
LCYHLYKARNLAISKAKGQFITFLDVDDTWKKNKLDEQLKLSSRYPLIKIFYSNFSIFNQKIKKSYLAYKYKLPSGYITQNLVNSYCVGILTLFISKNIFKKYKFNEKFNVIGDFDLIIRLSNKFKIISHQKSLANYRIHKNNYSKNLKIYLAEMSLWLKYNEKKLKKNNINLTKIKFFIFKLKIKLILKKLFNLDF